MQGRRRQGDGEGKWNEVSVPSGLLILHSLELHVYHCGLWSPGPCPRQLGCPLWTLPPSLPPGPLIAGSLLTDVVAKKEHTGPFWIIFRKFKKR